MVYDGKGLWFQKHVSSVFIEQRQSTTTEKSRLESMNLIYYPPQKCNHTYIAVRNTLQKVILSPVWFCLASPSRE